MNQEAKLLNHIHKAADMGRNSMEYMIKASDDILFVKNVRRQKELYESAYKTSSQMLLERKADKLEDAPAVTKMMAHMQVAMNQMAAASTSKLAQMVIQGSTMGVTELTRQIRNYKGNDKEVLDFAKKQLAQEEDNITVMKKFL